MNEKVKQLESEWEQLHNRLNEIDNEIEANLKETSREEHKKHLGKFYKPKHEHEGSSTAFYIYDIHEGGFSALRVWREDHIRTIALIRNTINNINVLEEISREDFVEIYEKTINNYKEILCQS